MYLKTIWNPGDIITTEKWNNINNNLMFHYIYQIPVDFTNFENQIPSQQNDSRWRYALIPLSVNEIQQKISQYGKNYCFLKLPRIFGSAEAETYTMFYQFDSSFFDNSFGTTVLVFTINDNGFNNYVEAYIYEIEGQTVVAFFYDYSYGSI